MSISKLNKLAGTRKAAANETITLSIEGEEIKMEFREPRITDLSVPDKIDKKIAARWPSLEKSERLSVFTAARCYVPADEEKKDYDGIELFGFTAAHQPFIFNDLVDQLLTAFPDFRDWLAAKAEAKND